MSIVLNQQRVGRFTSSEIYKLMTVSKDGKSFGKPALTYIHNKRQELKLGRSLSIAKGNRSTAWGQFAEKRVHDLLGMAYETVGDITIIHPYCPDWAGSPDLKNVRESVCGDTKCYEPENFCNYIDLLTEAYNGGGTDLWKKEYPAEYWQLVSNAIILQMKYIEAVVYMPYLSELKEIKEMAYNYDGPDQFKYRFIYEADEHELPYIPDNSQYKNLNKFRFEVPEDDKIALTIAVGRAIKLRNGETIDIPHEVVEAPVKALKTPKKVKQIEPVSLFDPNSIVLTPINK